jgi:CheY-like chemotaxis protein
VFRLFEQLKTTGNRRSGGVGLGLAISARLAELMNGSISVESVEGQGSLFTAMCKMLDPVNASTSSVYGATEKNRTPSRQQHIIVVDDDPVGARLARNMLEAEGYIVSVFNDGLSLIAALASMLPRTVDAIVIDLMMPDMGGFEATRAIRASQHWHSSLPIIATTANAMSQDAVTCLSQGMDGYLAKPFTRRSLADAVSKHLAIARHGHVSETDEHLLEFNLKWDDLMESCSNDVAQIREVIELIERTVPQYFNELHGSLRECDKERLRRSFHRIKGCLGNICSGPLIDRLDSFEELLRHPFGIDRIKFQIVLVERTAMRVVATFCSRLTDVLSRKTS